MFKRENTNLVKTKSLSIGHSPKILIQSMCDIKTSNIDEVVNQINDCASLGADLMRVSVLDYDDANAIKEIKKKIKIPLVADIHFDYKLAIASIENGADKIRINPGNIGSKDNIVKILEKAKEYDVAIRIGVNSGSLDKKYSNYKNLHVAMVKSALEFIDFFEKNHFYNMVISLKASDPIETIKAYKLAAKKIKYPLHVGITEAGSKDISLIRSSATLSPILLLGIGNTIRISITGNPQDEILAANRLLSDLKLKNNFVRIISCPTCGRTMVDLKKIVKQLEPELVKINKNLTVAIMGCIVNGPGEAKNADYGIAGGNNCFALFKKGKIIKTVDEKDVIEELLKIIK